MKVTVKNYQQLAERTLAALPTIAIDGAHMALGITTELGEMNAGIILNDVVNVREEHGDCFWYIGNECNIYGFDFNDLVQEALQTPFRQFHLQDLVDLHKKELAYKKQIKEEDLRYQLISLVQYLLSVGQKFGFTLEESLQINIDKLYARYPDKFNTKDAIERDLVKEREILEGNGSRSN